MASTKATVYVCQVCADVITDCNVFGIRANQGNRGENYEYTVDPDVQPRHYPQHIGCDYCGVNTMKLVKGTRTYKGETDAGQE